MAHDIYLPILTYPDPTPKAALLRAVDLAASIGGRLSVEIVTIDIPSIENVLAELLIDVSSMAADAEGRSRRVGAELEQEVSHLARRMALPVSVRHATCQLAQVASHCAAVARRHDVGLVVFDPDGEGHRALAEALLFESGAPLLLVAPEAKPAHLNTVVVGWDGSRAAARAVHDALPILRRAKGVVVATIESDKPIDLPSVDDLLLLLEFHDISATRARWDLHGQPIGDALQTAAIAMDAGLLVIGGFGHTRLREFILGGATATALQHPRLPLFLSH